MKTIGLCMIVKNEARVILRCLESVRPLVDYVLIEDTGSTDGTQDVIRQYLARENLQGEVFQEPWQDFAHNRSVVLRQLRRRKDIDYALVMDADDVLVLHDGFDVATFKEKLSEDCYEFELRRFDTVYSRPQLVRNDRHFEYRGVLHEVLVGPSNGYSTSAAEDLHIEASGTGARSADPDKYRNDARVLERALSCERDPWLRSRYTFYLAQSYWDCGEKEKALEYYSQRTTQGFSKEEIYWSYYRTAQTRYDLGHPLDHVLPYYSSAFRIAPHRAEPMHYAARFCRTAKRFKEGYDFAKSALGISRPHSGLFIEPWIYDYGLLDEFAVNAYWVEDYEASLEACERLLAEGKVPAKERRRIEQNAQFARGKLGISGGAAPNIKIAGERESRIPNSFVFTLTTGRSGTAFLTALLKKNLPNAVCHHELIGWQSFGLDTPDLSDMMTFNSAGNIAKVQEFWRRKLSRAAATDAEVYVETSHLLMKSGLVENLKPNLPDKHIHLVALERDPVATLISFRERFDFLNKGNMWLWYLDPDYPKKIVPFAPFSEYGVNGIRLWYIMEIRARAAYYEILLQAEPNITFHKFLLDDLRKPEGIAKLLNRLGAARAESEIEIPPAQNVTVGEKLMPDSVRAEIHRMIEAARCDPVTHAADAIRRGFRF